MKAANAYKQKDFPVIEIFQYLFLLIFSNHSMYMNLITGRNTPAFAKDTVYRFMKMTQINRMRFTTIVASRIIKTAIEPLTGEDLTNVLILDDSLFERSRSKKVEILAKTYDHAKHRFCFGFRMLTLGWSDGNTFLPINSVLLSSENKQNRLAEAAPMDKRTVAYKRRALSVQKRTQVMLELLKMFFRYQGEGQSLISIYRKNKKRRRRSRYLLSVEVEIIKDGNVIPAKVVYVRNRNNRKDYLCLLSTDLSLEENEIIRLYGKRWDIEVFFKVCKSYLKLSRECHSLSYDAMTAHTAVVFTRYKMLSLESRESNDIRSLGELFLYISDEMADIT